MLDPRVDPVPSPSVASLDHIQQIEREWLVEPIGQLSADRMAEIDLALHAALAIEICPPR